MLAVTPPPPHLPLPCWSQLLGNPELSMQPSNPHAGWRPEPSPTSASLMPSPSMHACTTKFPSYPPPDGQQPRHRLERLSITLYVGKYYFQLHTYC